jgi:hypothetical protein
MGSKLDKNPVVAPAGSSAHSILWIFSSLSTKQAETNRFHVGQRGFSGLAAGLVDVAPASNRLRVRSRTFFFAKQDGRTVDVASGVAGVTGPESKIFFSTGPGIQGESSGLQPEACIQNDGSS